MFFYFLIILIITFNNNAHIDAFALQGMNMFGQVDASALLRPVPQLINMGPMQGKRITSMSAGCEHSLVLTADNILFAWGR